MLATTMNTMMTVKPPEGPQRRRAGGGGPALHPAHPSNRLYGESLFGLFSRYSTFVAAGAERMGELIEQAFGHIHPLLAEAACLMVDVRPDAQIELCEALDLSSEALTVMTCTPYMSREEASHHAWSPMLSRTLRYCPLCLQLGFHSMLYQHRAVKDCPHHGVALLDRCSHCASPWDARIKQIVEEPFCCPKCRWLHLKTVLPPDGAADLKAAAGAIFPRVHDLETNRGVPHERVNVFSLSDGCGSYLGLAAQRRLWQRVAAWPKQLNAHWDRFREETRFIGEANWPREGVLRTRDWEDVAEQPTATLRWLVQECAAPAEECRRLLGGAWQRMQYITPLYQDRQLSAVAAALHLTLAKYGWLQINFRSLDQGWQRDHPHHAVRWNGWHEKSSPRTFGQTSGALIASEIRGYFVLSLLRCAGLQPLKGGGAEFGQSHYLPYSYCPSWILQREGRTGWELRIRHRADEALVHRLLKRYKSTALQRMVVSTWPTSPAIPEVARLTELSFPPELIEFPKDNRGRSSSDVPISAAHREGLDH